MAAPRSLRPHVQLPALVLDQLNGLGRGLHTHAPNGTTAETTWPRVSLFRQTATGKHFGRSRNELSFLPVRCDAARSAAARVLRACRTRARLRGPKYSSPTIARCAGM